MIGADRSSSPAGSAILGIADVLLTGEADLPGAVRKANDGRGAEVVYGCVGGKAMFATALNCLAHRGRLVEISATGGRDVQFDLADFYHNETRLFGVDSLKRDLVQSARMLDALRPYFEDGTFRLGRSPQPIHWTPHPKHTVAWPRALPGASS